MRKLILTMSMFGLVGLVGCTGQGGGSGQQQDGQMQEQPQPDQSGAQMGEPAEPPTDQTTGQVPPSETGERAPAAVAIPTTREDCQRLEEGGISPEEQEAYAACANIQ